MAASSQNSRSNSGSDLEFLEDEDEEPTEEQVIEYAEFLGMDLKTEMHLLWIAREGVAAPVPHPWKTCTEKGDVFYFNFETSESSWEHPCDAHYRTLLEDHRKGVKVDGKPADGKDPGEAGTSTPADAKDDKKDEDGGDSFVSEMVESEVEDERGEVKDGASSPWSSEASDGDPAGKDPSHSSHGKLESAQSGGQSAGDAQKTEESTARESAEKSEKPGILGSKVEAPLNDKALSEVSEDFRSDWGAPSPLGSSAPGLLNPAPHSLEVSVSDVGSVLGPGTPQAAPVKSWGMLKEDVKKLMQVLSSMENIRKEQSCYLQRLQGKELKS